jgi:peptidoglycan/LPS O-acetylase OafA/YrhL
MRRVQEYRVNGAHGRFVVLDSWRGIAALLVVLFHGRYQSHIYAVPLIRHGWLAVDFFFVLSGFVISYAYGRRIATGRDLGVFLIRRTGRIWPLHVFMLAAFVLPWARAQAALYLAARC